MAIVEVKVPDIGDFKDVPVIDVLVKPGDAVKPEDPLVTLESDKATMDVPSPAEGTVKSIAVKMGDKVSQGSALLTLDSGEAAAGPAAKAARAPVSAAAPGSAAKAERAPASAAQKPPTSTTQSAPAKPASPPAAAPGGKTPATQRSAPGAGARHADIECDDARARFGSGRLFGRVSRRRPRHEDVLVERFATLGGVCLNVGCIPSKALLHTAFVMDEVRTMGAHGIRYPAPVIDLDKLRGFKDGVVRKLTGGLAGMAKARKVDIVRGIGRFIDAHHLEVALTSGNGREVTGEKKTIRFEQAIIAAGSEAVKLPFMPDDPRIVDATGALELPSIPKRMLVVGGGIIGLEMANVYSSLGSRIDVVEMLDGVMMGADRDLVKVWEKKNAPRFDRVMLKTKTVAARGDEGRHPR